MGRVTYEALNIAVLRFGAEQRRVNGFCPFGCRGEESGVVCVGLTSGQRKILVVNSWGMMSDVLPGVVHHLVDCPVVRHLKNPTIKLD
jgi:hypothetical protein